MHVLFLFKKAPWWLFTVLAVFCFFAAEMFHRMGTGLNQDRQAALSQPVPAPIDLANFRWASDRNLANEINVTGWIDWDNTVLLIDLDNSGETKAERSAYFLFGASDTPQDRQVRAVMLLDDVEDEHFTVNEGSYLLSKPGDPSEILTYQFNGIAKRFAKFAAMAKDAMQDRGLSPSEDMIFIQPFFNGRAAGLAPLENLAVGRIAIHGLGGIILLGSGILFALQRRKQSAIDAGDLGTQQQSIINPEALVTSNIPVPPISNPDTETQTGTLAERFSNLLTLSTFLNIAGTILGLLVLLMPSWLVVFLPLAALLWAYANVEKVRTAIDGAIENARGKPKFPEIDPFDRVGN